MFENLPTKGIEVRARVARPCLPEGLGQGVGRAGQDVVEGLHARRGRIERGHHRGSRGLRPRRLGDGVLEERPFRGHACEHGRGRPLVAVERQVVAPQRVGPDEDHALRRLAVAEGRGHGLVDHRRAPEPERAFLLRRQGQGQRHLSSCEAIEIDAHALPPVRRRHRPLRDHLLLVRSVLDADLEDGGPRLERPDRQPHARTRGQRDVEPQRIGRAGHERLAVDLTQTLPAHSRADAGQMLLARDHPDRLDLEGGPRGVRGTDEEVARCHGDRARRP